MAGRSVPLVPLRERAERSFGPLLRDGVRRRREHGAVRAGASARALPVLPRAALRGLHRPRQHLQGTTCVCFNNITVDLT